MTASVATATPRSLAARSSSIAAAVVAGALAATFALLLFGAQRDAAFGESAPASAKVARVAPGGWQPAPATAAPAPADPAPVVTAAAAPSAKVGRVSAAANTSIIQCNGTDNVGGQAVECSVDIINNLDMSTGVTSSTVTVSECHGAANVPLTCPAGVTTASSDLVTAVDQCNGSGNGGGGNVRCNVTITNNITGNASVTPATVNQCNSAGTGGGTAPTTNCDPYPANTTNATVTQCNGSGNGGGGTMRVTCTVGTGSTESSALGVTVEQCIGSGNDGGALVTCSTSITNNVIAAAVTPVVVTPVVTPGTGGTTTGGTPVITPAPVVPTPTKRVIVGSPQTRVPTGAVARGGPDASSTPATRGSLPTTGSSSRDLAGGATAAILVGSLLVLGSRRRPAPVAV